MTAEEFIRRLTALASAVEREKIQRYFKGGVSGAIGVRMREVTDLAKEFVGLPRAELNTLLDSPIREAKVGALSVMNTEARLKRTSEERRKELYDLYLSRMDVIDNWDLVDLAAPWVVGRYLEDKPRDVLDVLARSANPWERRTAVYASLYFTRIGDTDDIYRLAELLIADPHDLVQKAVGAVLREAGRKDRPRLLAFLDRHAAAMPRTMLSYAIEHLTADEKATYRAKRR
ncbi:DNA alkylation repair protein [Sinosporangium siamense]|uniref:DNA alkylation repair protein n=1 Tax=Sinosporangium siamense TaxID=1367973 RepID=A0A919RJN2_9ACTN|nr:DNA alkylation repair protein [Sinosporangium siamense]GII94055.1 DNA alkylation repair protein [Sinosporangium siamense]